MNRGAALALPESEAERSGLLALLKSGDTWTFFETVLES